MKQLVLNSGKLVIVDDIDYPKVALINWSENKSKHARTTYAHARINKIPTYLHRFILNVTEAHLVVDHIDGNGLNNTRDNLRVVTQQENMFNRRSRGVNTSKYFGVFKQEGRNRFRAAAKHPIKGRVYLGSHILEIDAAKAYNKFVIDNKLDLPINVFEEI